MKLLAIDIGASGGKAVVGEFHDNRLVTDEIRRFPNRITDINGHKHWDILGLFEEVKNCLKAAPDVGSVGISTWGVDYGYIGHDDDLISNPFSYRDARTEKSVSFVHEKIPMEEIYTLTGTQFMPFNTIYQVADDVRSRPWVFENAKSMMMIPDLLGWLLTGIEVNEYSNASTTGMLDVNNGEWSAYIYERIGFPGDKLLKPVVKPGSVQADLRPEIIKETGCNAKFTFVATHDTASAIAAIPADGENWAYISSGTWSLVGMELGEPILTDQARENNFTNEGGVDGTIRFLKNVSGLWLLAELKRMWSLEGKDVGFDTILTESEKAPKFRSIVDPDHPSFVAPLDMRVAIRDYCESTGQTVPKGVGPFSRCVFESLALKYRSRIKQLASITGRKIEKIHVVGGGSRNRLLCQMTADACGMPVMAGPTEATALGNLIVQGVANKEIGSVMYGRRVVSNSIDPITYEPENSGLWDKVKVG